MTSRLSLAMLVLALSCNPTSAPAPTGVTSRAVSTATPAPVRGHGTTRDPVVRARPGVALTGRTHYVVLEGESVVSRMRRQAEAGRPRSARAAQTHGRELRQAQQRLEPELTAAGAQVVGRLIRLANALLVVADPAAVARLRRLAGVRRVEAAPVYRHHLTESVGVLGAPALWQATSDLLGRNVRVGVVDSGIDYTHAAFGGSGDVTDYLTNDSSIIEPGTFPTARVVDGTDLVGNLYDSGSSANDVPLPDPDPLDCDDHGTHVASILGGGGVTWDGSAYAGPYNLSLDPAAFEVGPGVAPAADLYAIKVFGCDGSTSVVTLALEWASDPNGDGLFDDRLDVVNLSLGSKFGLGSTDPIVTENLVWLGAVVVASSGNTDSDVKRARPFFVTDSPATVHPVISVANSWKTTVSYRVLEIAGATIGPFPVAEGRDNPTLETTGTITGPIRRPVNRDGCDPFTNASQFPGTIALIDRGNCGWNAKFQNAEAAGAVAAVVVDWSGHDVPYAMTNIGANLPGGMIRTPHGEAIHAALESGAALTGTLDAAQWWPATVGPDYIKDSSCRGPSAWDGLGKPDLAAPGTYILAAASGTGWEDRRKSGTSMSAPHVAGAAALLLEADAALSPLEIKARFMSTARPVVDMQGHPFPVSLAGAGRLQVDAALQTPAYLITLDSGGAPSPLVSAGWGAQVSASPFELTHQVRVVNPSAAAVSYTVTTEPFRALTGTTVTATPGTITVGPGSSADVELRLSVDPALLEAPSLDEVSPPVTYPDVGRHFVMECDGLVRFTPTSPTGAPDLSLPFHAMLRAASEREVGEISGCVPGNASTEVTVRFSDAATVDGSQVTSAFVHLPGAAVPPLAALGVTHNLHDAAADPELAPTLYFGLATAVDWLLPARYGRSAVGLDIDVDGDEAYDFTVSMDSETRADDGDFGNADVFTVRVYPYGSYRGDDLTPLRVNVADPRDLRAPVHLTSVYVLPVRLADLGLSPPPPTIGVRGWARQPDEDIIDGEHVTFTPLALPFDPTVAGWSVPGFGRTPLHAGDRVRVILEPDASAGDPPPDLLLLHHHNEHGARVEVVSLDPADTAYEQGDLGVQTQSATGLARTGHTASATFVVTNHGPGDLADVSLDIALSPAAVTVGDATVVTSAGSCADPDASGTIHCDLGAMAESAQITVEVTLAVTLTLPAPGQLSINGTVTTGLACDGATGNNTASTTITVTPIPEPPEDPDSPKKGCGCQSQDPAGGLLLLLLLLMIWGRRRIRNRMTLRPVVPREDKELYG